MLRIVINRIRAELVGPIDVGEERVGDRRIAIHNLDADAIALAEAIGDRLERNLDLIDLAGGERGCGGNFMSPLTFSVSSLKLAMPIKPSINTF